MSNPHERKSDAVEEPPVRVVDRRWWAREGATSEGQPAADEALSAKPTYVEQLERQLAEKDRALQEVTVRYREAAREFDEARARLRKEIGKDVERTRRAVIAEFLDVLDNLDRAVEAGRSAATASSVVEGVDLVRRQFLATLESLGVVRIEADGGAFDPVLHEAVTTVPVTSSHPENTIAGVVRQGYRVGEEVLRPAAVAVARGSN